MRYIQDHVGIFDIQMQKENAPRFFGYRCSYDAPHASQYHGDDEGGFPPPEEQAECCQRQGRELDKSSDECIGQLVPSWKL